MVGGRAGEPAVILTGPMGKSATTTRCCSVLLRGSMNAWTTLQKHPQPPIFHPGLLNNWPISCPQGIKPLHTVIAFADQIADPIGFWENYINWWSHPITAEFCEQVTFVLYVGPNVAHVGLNVIFIHQSEGAYLWASVPQAPCLLVRMLTIFCFNWLAVTWSLCLAALIRWSHIFSSSFLSAAY